jgi:uncharacterized protein
MLFKRRQQPGFWQRFRLWLWPRVSFRRSWRYFLKRILRLSGTPYAIAMGAAVGVGIAFTPLLGFHYLLTFSIAWLLGGNMIAGAIASSIGNPLTFPMIWASTYQLGRFILEGVHRNPPVRLESEITHKSLVEILPLIEPMMVGAIPLGIAAGALVYLIVYNAVSSYQAARRRRLQGRRGEPPMAGVGQKS